MQGRGKREIPEKTHPCAASSNTIPNTKIAGNRTRASCLGRNSNSEPPALPGIRTQSLLHPRSVAHQPNAPREIGIGYVDAPTSLAIRRLADNAGRMGSAQSDDSQDYEAGGQYSRRIGLQRRRRKGGGERVLRTPFPPSPRRITLHHLPFNTPEVSTVETRV
ncbi:hypothetical protein PR048_027554 [Dryococelus australis]|uniref:Uncharacterized protein n=1 Tax=Dryococelus australis TaxID=614101 RepID=A0ABQ9GGU9_9NEOP|nr:hypothetical protein PR048_027554 [Dryococelus australis]